MVKRKPDVIVIGAGIAGLAATVAFARSGYKVWLIERDSAPPPATADESFLEWDRPGVPQRRLVHGFLPLARQLLMQNLPDVVERLEAAGARQVDQLDAVVDRVAQPGDEELFVLRSRRTVFEWVLRRVVDTEPGVTVVAGDPVAGLTGTPAKLTGVRLRSGGALDAELVIDAAGRRSGVSTWLAELGAGIPAERAEPCGLVYFSRFYRHRDGDLPVDYRGVLGYSNVTATQADGLNFSLTFFARVEEPRLRLLRDEAAFERAVDSIEGFREWHEGATPLGGVSSMGELRNSIRDFVVDGATLLPGLVPIGDTLSHTNPSLGRGMSLGLDHAFKAAGIPWADVSVAEGGRLYHAQVDPMSEASFADAVAVDSLTKRLYAGDATARHEPRSLILRARTLAAAEDQDLYRATLRDFGLLEPRGWIACEPWISRARALVQRHETPPQAGPDLEEMVAILEGRD